MKQLSLLMIAVMLCTFLLTVAACRILIPRLRSLKMGQKILDIGPRWHKNKEGTPTMGGITFIIAAVIVIFFISLGLYVAGGAEGIQAMIPFYAVLIFALLNGGIGALDDYVKFSKNQNEGLSAAQKYLLQLMVAGLFLIALKIMGLITTELRLPFCDITLELGIFYYVIALLLITGMVNSVNLTDGIDGLAAGETFIVSLFLAGAAIATFHLPTAMTAGVAAGSALGFLVYNLYPARVFMGDTGSLYLGALLIGCGFIMNNPLIVMIAGIMFLVETASVVLQTSYFKLTKKRYGEGRRIFKMSPIHHHFEMCGWRENKIVTVFCLINLIFSAISFILEYKI